MKIIAHRGASREFPENTLRAFERAIEIGVDAIETDVRQTADGILVLHHDESIDVDGRPQAIGKLTYEKLKKISSDKSAPIATLEELLEMAGWSVGLCLELKEAGIVPKVIAMIQKYDLGDNVHVTSFLQPEILEACKLWQALSVSVTFEAVPAADQLIKAGIYEVSLPAAVITAAPVVAKLKRAGLRVRVYTVNAPEDAARLESWGVDAIFTDDPGAMQSYRQ